MTSKQRGILAVFLWIAVSVLAVTVVHHTPQRWDLTSDQRHTLSDSTHALLRTVQSPLEIRAFLPTHIPAPYSVVVDAIKDRLNDYASACSQPVRITIRDPLSPDLTATEQAVLIEEAKGYGLQIAELEVIQRDRQVRQKVWFGIALLYQDRQVVVPPIETPQQLEYSMAQALRDVIRGPGERPVIGFTVGHGEPNIMQTPLRPMLEGSGIIKTVPLDGNPIPNDVDALVILGPRRPMNARDRYVIDQFLLRGGGLVALLDYRSQSTIYPDVLVPTLTGLEELFAHYGATIDTTRTILDRGSQTPVPIKQDKNGKVVMGTHPLFARTQLASHIINRGITQLMTPMASPIEVGLSAARDHHVEPIVKSVDGSMTRLDVRHSQPEVYLTPDKTKENGEQAIVSVTITGLLRSAFKEQVPQHQPGPSTVGREDFRPDRPFISRGKADARVVLITSGGRLLSSGQSGLMFLQNSVDWVVSDTSLAGIRARQAEEPQLTQLSESVRWTARVGTILLPGLLLLMIALYLRRGDPLS